MVRIFSRVAVSSVATILLLGVSPPYAQAGTVLDNLFATDERAKVCFAQQESSTKSELDQPFEIVRLEFGYGRHPSSTDKSDTYRTYYFNLWAEVRGQDLTSVGECSEKEGRIWCGIECDGGGFYVNLQTTGLRLTPDPMNSIIRLTSSCEANSVEIDLRLVDRQFERVESALCDINR